MDQTPDAVDRIEAEWRRERPELDTEPPAIIGRLHRLARHLTDEIVPVQAAYGLREGEFDVLAALRRAGDPFERTAGELAAATMITTGGMTKRIDRLVEMGLVVRRSHAGDGRVRTVGLTERGRALIDEAYPAHIANEQRLLAAVAPQDRDELRRILRGWLAAFE